VLIRNTMGCSRPKRGVSETVEVDVGLDGPAKPRPIPQYSKSFRLSVIDWLHVAE
jgi:hypothetical protein